MTGILAVTAGVWGSAGFAALLGWNPLVGAFIFWTAFCLGWAVKHG